jgi:hypothetical protein
VRKNCSTEREKLLKFEAEGREFEKISANSERSEKSLVTKCFLTSSWRFIISNKLEQLEFKCEKIIGI